MVYGISYPVLDEQNNIIYITLLAVLDFDGQKGIVLLRVVFVRCRYDHAADDPRDRRKHDKPP